MVISRLKSVAVGHTRSLNALQYAVSGLVLLAGARPAFAEQHTTGVPIESSRPGALYTVYIDPSGFNYPGMWAGSTPGNNPALNNVAASGAFDPLIDVPEINAIYASLANKYRSFNVNVTTVDPAIAGLAAQGITSPTDAQRVDYYDSQAHMMHTIVGPGASTWHGNADGLAAGDISVVTSGGGHTNWMFTDGHPATVADGTYIGGIDAHETGHTFGLSHQSDYVGSTRVNEYTDGDATGGPGSYTAIMGGADSGARQRVTWRVGPSNGGSVLSDDPNGSTAENFQNDVKTILSKNGAALVDSGIGHSFVTATAIPLVGQAVDLSSALHRGVISPTSAANPNPIDPSNYTQDVFSFKANGTDTVKLTAYDGDDLLAPGTADPGATLRSILKIFSASNLSTPVATVAEDPSTLYEAFSSQLAAGDYYAEIMSYGGHNEVSGSNADGTFAAAQYFDMGGYFINGSGFAAVPEPTLIGFFAFGTLGMLARRRRSAI